MYLINNKNYLCKKFIRRKKQVAKYEFIVLNVFCERVEILRMLHTNNTVKPVQDNHSWEHSKVVVLDRWSPYKTPQ